MNNPLYPPQKNNGVGSSLLALLFFGLALFSVYLITINKSEYFGKNQNSTYANQRQNQKKDSGNDNGNGNGNDNGNVNDSDYSVESSEPEIQEDESEELNHSNNYAPKKDEDSEDETEEPTEELTYEWQTIESEYGAYFGLPDFFEKKESNYQNPAYYKYYVGFDGGMELNTWEMYLSGDGQEHIDSFKDFFYTEDSGFTDVYIINENEKYLVLSGYYYDEIFYGRTDIVNGVAFDYIFYYTNDSDVKQKNQVVEGFTDRLNYSNVRGKSDEDDTEESDTETPENREFVDGQLFPNSSNEYLSEDVVSKLTQEEIQYAINEIYARNGYIFGTEEGWYDYYIQFSWYQPSVPREDFDDSYFNDVEYANVKLLASYRD